MTSDIIRVPINDITDIICARLTVRREAARIGFSTADQTRVATAVSEIARNVINYATAGVCTLRDESTVDELHLQVTIEDHGPGIPHVAEAMRDGYSTGGGLGAGLPGTRRLVNKFSIESRSGYTRVTFSLMRKRS